MSTRNISRRTLGVLACLALVGSTGCGDVVTQGHGSSYLTVVELLAASGADKAKVYTNVLRSDVRTGSGIFEDNGRVVLRLGMKDASPLTGPTPTSNNIITVTRYHVSYRRSDGRNQPGVDVPYAFDGGVTFTVTTDATADFSIVRAVAKEEAPLIQLAGMGGANYIATLADVTFYGQDQAGNEVSVTGTISINFADWADPS